MKITAGQIQTFIGGELLGNPDLEITGFAPIEAARPHCLCFADGTKYEALIDSLPSCTVVVNKNYSPGLPISATLIRVSNPRLAMGILLKAWQEKNSPPLSGREEPCYVHPQAAIAEDVYIGAFSYIAAGVRLAAGVQIHPQVYVGSGAIVEEGSILYPGVKIYAGTRVGRRCIIHAGAIIGADGFGFVPDEKGVFTKVAQVGCVVIEDEVEIGANTCIDRAALGETIIRTGTKLDNLIQIAHNVEIGPHCGIAAQAGIAGSTRIGCHTLVGGQAGITGHITIAEGSKINAQSGVSKNIDIPQKSWTGSPAREFREAYRMQAYLSIIPVLKAELKEMQEKIKRWEENYDKTKND